MKRMIGLVLQGGGALGAYEYGAVQEIYDRGIRPDIISGVSIGAINAAVLAGYRHDPIKDLEGLWHDLSLELPRLPFRCERFASTMFGHPRFWHLRPDFLNFWGCTSFCDVDLLIPTLKKYIDLKKINEGKIKLILGAMDVEDGKFVEFCNFDMKDKKKTDIQYKHILASGSLPPGFPMTEIDGRHYWDGGLICSMPLKPVTDAFKELYPDDMKIIYTIALMPLAGAVPTNMFQVGDRMLEIIYGDKTNRLDTDLKQLRAINELVLQAQVKSYAEAMMEDKALRVSIKREPDGETHYYYLFNEVYIPYRESTRPNGIEDLFGAADFTSSSIEHRIKMGRADAKAALDEKGVSAALPMGRIEASAYQGMSGNGDGHGHGRGRGTKGATVFGSRGKQQSAPQAGRTRETLNQAAHQEKGK